MIKVRRVKGDVFMSYEISWYKPLLSYKDGDVYRLIPVPLAISNFNDEFPTHPRKMVGFFWEWEWELKDCFLKTYGSVENYKSKYAYKKIYHNEYIPSPNFTFTPSVSTTPSTNWGTITFTDEVEWA